MIFAAILFIILGILIKNRKMYNLIAGYNTMSKEEKANYNIEKIAALFRNVMFFMASIIILGYILSKILNNPSYQEILFWIAIVMGIPYLLVRSNSKKFKSNG